MHKGKKRGKKAGCRARSGSIDKEFRGRTGLDEVRENRGGRFLQSR